MSDTMDIDSLRRRCTRLQEIDSARNTLLDDMLQKLDDMQKRMDRDAFVMVLIDGDCMNFLNVLVKGGVTGGEEAAKLLRRAIFDYLRHDEHFKHDHKIVIRVYANFRGLAKTYVDKKVLPAPSVFSDFVLGFNKAHPLCDFVDAGNHKEAADTKLKENVSVSMYNVHCKQIIFGASADNGYASFLSSFFVDTDVSARLRLLKGAPFSAEFKHILPKFRWTEFRDVFRTEAITDDTEHQDFWSKDIATQAARVTLSPVDTLVSWRPVRAATRDETDGLNRQSVHGAVHGFLATLSTNWGADQAIEGHDNQHKHGSQSSLSSWPSVNELSPSVRQTPTEEDIMIALVQTTIERLQCSPKALDFGTVKQLVEQKLGLPSSFWGSDEQHPWFLKSKNVIKFAVEEWVERTDNPPPKNATWMLRYFNTEASPSSVMKSPSSKVWRTEMRPKTRRPSSPLIDYSLIPVCWNSKGQRIDKPDQIQVNQKVLNDLRARQPRLCNAHCINRSCSDLHCPYDHQPSLTSDERKALIYFARSQRCPRGSACRSDKCIKGHMCPNGRPCIHGAKCWFANLHDVDSKPAGWLSDNEIS